MMRLLENAHKLRASSQPRHPSGGGIVTGGGRITLAASSRVGGGTVGDLGFGASGAGADTGDVAACAVRRRCPCRPSRWRRRRAPRAPVARARVHHRVQRRGGLRPHAGAAGESPRQPSFLGSTGVGMSSTRRTPSQVREQLGPRRDRPRGRHGRSRASARRSRRAGGARRSGGRRGTPPPDFAFDFNLMITESRVPEKCPRPLWLGGGGRLARHACCRAVLHPLGALRVGRAAGGGGEAHAAVVPPLRRAAPPRRPHPALDPPIGAGVAELARMTSTRSSRS